MIKSKTIGSRIFTVVNTLILAILALSCLYPLWYTCLLYTSFLLHIWICIGFEPRYRVGRRRWNLPSTLIIRTRNSACVTRSGTCLLYTSIMQWTGLNELREKYLSFFEEKGHLRLPSFSLIPKDDNSLLLINSGMAPMKKYFTGEVTPPRKLSLIHI